MKGSADAGILTLNGGSSSIRFAFFPAGEPRSAALHGKVDRLGQDGTTLSVHDPTGVLTQRLALPASDHRQAAHLLLQWLGQHIDFSSLLGVGHRVVHGMQHAQPACITSALLEELHQMMPCAPNHLPTELALIEALQNRHPQLAQLACFDTAFHHHMPRVARLLAIPRRYADKGIVRYGFHGLSYAYLLEELQCLGDPAARRGRVILAHLGNGASLAAVRDGSSVDTSMGFTPGSGIPMGTRSGDLDPGLVSYLARSENMDAAHFHQMVNHESGLLGLSGISSDLRDLLGLEESDTAAADAVSLFCYQTKKCIGAYAAALGGLDSLVFAGGIGENAAQIRARICEGLDFLGIKLSPERNAVHASRISSDNSQVAVHVIHTNEELMIARLVFRQFGQGC